MTNTRWHCLLSLHHIIVFFIFITALCIARLCRFIAIDESDFIVQQSNDRFIAMSPPPVCLSLLPRASLLPDAVAAERQLHHLVQVLGERCAQRRQLVGRAILERLHFGRLEAPDGVVHILHGGLRLGSDRRKGVPEVFEQLVERQVQVAQLFLDVGPDEL